MMGIEEIVRYGFEVVTFGIFCQMLTAGILLYIVFIRGED